MLCASDSCHKSSAARKMTPPSRISETAMSCRTLVICCFLFLQPVGPHLIPGPNPRTQTPFAAGPGLPWRRWLDLEGLRRARRRENALPRYSREAFHERGGDRSSPLPCLDGRSTMDYCPTGLCSLARAGQMHARERAMPYRVRLQLRGIHWRINSGTIYEGKTPRVGDQIEVEIDGRRVLACVGNVRSYQPKMTGASAVDEIDAEEI